MAQNRQDWLMRRTTFWPFSHILPGADCRFFDKSGLWSTESVLGFNSDNFTRHNSYKPSSYWKVRSCFAAMLPSDNQDVQWFTSSPYTHGLVVEQRWFWRPSGSHRWRKLEWCHWVWSYQNSVETLERKASVHCDGAYSKASLTFVPQTTTVDGEGIATKHPPETFSLCEIQKLLLFWGLGKLSQGA